MNFIEIITSNPFVLMSSLVAITLISGTIAIFEIKGATFGRNILLIVLLFVGLFPIYLYPEIMTGVIYQLPCAILGALIGLNLPRKWLSIKQ